jgi:hypothetical protein
MLCLVFCPCPQLHCLRECLQEWAGLQHAAAAIKQGLCNAVRRLSGEAATAVTLDGVIIAKVGQAVNAEC